MGVGSTLRSDVDPDLWGHLRFGRYFLEYGLPPLPDIFSYASTGPWIDHEWLCEVFYYLAWQSMGEAGYFLVKAAFGAIVAVLLLLHANRGRPFESPTREETPILATTIVFCAAFLCLQNGFLLRPQLFTYVWAACLMHVYILVREGKSGWLCTVPILMAIWANVHAGVVAGLGLLTLFCVGDTFETWNARRRGETVTWKRPRQLLLTLLVGTLATLATPYGLDYWPFLWRAATLPRTYITEWATVAWKFDDARYILCAGVFAFALIRSRLRKSPTEILIFIVLLHLGLSHKRHMMLFAIITGMTMAPHVADCFRRKWEAPETSGRGPAILRSTYIAAIALFLASLVIVFVEQGLKIPVNPSWYPVAAVRFIRENGITGNLYPTFNWGQYAIWHLHPQCRVGADGRYETVYSPEHEKNQMAFDRNRDGWEQVLDAYPTEIVLCPNQLHFRLAMSSRTDWAKVYEDTTAMVFLKRSERFSGLIDKASRQELLIPQIATREYFP